MFRRLIITTAVLTATLCTTAGAFAAVTRDPGYGQNGTAGIAVECAPGTFQGMVSQVAYGGRIFLFQQCAHGFNRLIAVGDDGKVDTTYGTAGHVSIKFPSPCFGGRLMMVPTKSGSLFIVSEGGYVGYEQTTELHVCSVRLSPDGTLSPTYGGTTPFRQLDRVSQGSNYLVDAAVDSLGRLVLFSARDASDWQHTAEFINRYATNGKPDVSFSQDGERAYVQAFAAGMPWGGVVGTKPVIAIYVAASHSGNLTGTQFVRFDDRGDLDGTFSHDGSRYVTLANLDGARVSWGAIAVDNRERIVFCSSRWSSYGARTDVFRLTRTGSMDTSFNAGTAPMVTPSGYDAVVQSLSVTNGHYVVDWSAYPKSGGERYRATGFSDSDGSRWSALGVQGSANLDEPQVAPDAAQFYLTEDFYSGGSNITAIFVTREIVE